MMKITPDYKGRNDEYDDDTMRYYEEIYDDGYFYELYAMIDGIKSVIIITEHGVSIDFHDGERKGSNIHTNIVPQQLFMGREKLSWGDLETILKILENTGCEGHSYSAEEIRAAYDEWKNLGKP